MFKIIKKTYKKKREISGKIKKNHNKFAISNAPNPSVSINNIGKRFPVPSSPYIGLDHLKEKEQKSIIDSVDFFSSGIYGLMWVKVTKTFLLTPTVRVVMTNKSSLSGVKSHLAKNLDMTQTLGV